MSDFDFLASLIDSLSETWKTKPLIIVEGKDDLPFYRHLFSRIAPDWEDRWGLEAAGNKDWVFRVCRRVPVWRGIVDRDTWSADKIEEAKTQTPSVLVLPRFTVQNYWIHPEELWIVLPEHQRNAHPQAKAEVKRVIEKALDDWVAHGAMWKVMLDCRAQLGEGLGFPKRLMDAPVTDATQIRAILNEWHAHLSPDTIISTYDSTRCTLDRLDITAKYRAVIHGKRFFRGVVVRALNRGFGQKSAKVWEELLIQGMATTPDDLAPLLQALLI